jgi:hypothetical protein
MPSVFALRRTNRRRLSLALLALAWLAQQFGFAAHSAMQLRRAAGGMGEICTGAGLVRAPVDHGSSAPAERAPPSGSVCDVCTAGTLPAHSAPAGPLFTIAQLEVAAASTGSTPAANDPRLSAHRARAPPSLLS